MTERFKQCLKVVLKFEGGYTVDTGGPTMKGITQAEYDRWRKKQNLPTRPVKEITSSEVTEIYHEFYWKLVYGDILPPPLDLVVFDSAVNVGVKRAAGWLIDIVASYRPEMQNQPLAKVAEFLRTRPASSILHIARRLLWTRLAFYQRLAQKPKYSPYLKGWTNRVIALSKIVGEKEA